MTNNAINIEKSLADLLNNIEEVRLGVIFGSRARGDATLRSDIDLAVSCPGISETRWAEIEAAIQSVDTLLFIDVTRLDEAEGAFREEILKQGRTIFERP